MLVLGSSLGTLPFLQCSKIQQCVWQGKVILMWQQGRQQNPT
jgi:hypothetical protein